MSDHDDALTAPTAFRYQKPELDRSKRVVVLGRTDRLLCMVHVVKEGGENNLHSHPHTDGMWIVLRGRVRFYGDNDEVLGEFGPHEGMFMPRGSRYRFEIIGDEELEIMAAQAFDVSMPTIQAIMDDRVNHATMHLSPHDVPRSGAAVH